MEHFHDKRTNLPVSKRTERFYWHAVLMTFIEENTSTIIERTWPFTKDSRYILLARSPDDILRIELFHDKRTNLTFFNRFIFLFIGTDSWWHLLKGSSFTIRERTWPFTSDSCSIYLTQNSDDIYWMEPLTWNKKDINRFRKTLCRFYWDRVLMAFLRETLPR
jgi:hypothetical protein